MTSTIEEKASFDQQAQFVDQEVIQEPKSENEGSISDSVVLHKILSRNSNADVVYLKVDFEKKIKKDTYRKINKVLGEK
jgi:hypothetical protein